MLLGFYYPKRYHGGKTMKRTVSFALSAVLALAMLIFIGCKGNETQPKQADVEAVYTKLVESGQLPSMTKVPERDLEEVYGNKACAVDNVPVRKLCGHSRRSFDF